MGGNPLTQQVAERALKKLDAKDIRRKGATHPTYAIYHGKTVVATTGLRHSPKKDMLVPHLKNDLRVNVQFILGLANCTKYLNDWLLEIGIIKPTQTQTQTQQQETKAANGGGDPVTQ
jgi:hypothetical protein